MDRRAFLAYLAALGVTGGLTPARAQFQSAPKFSSDPFTLGVASGYPSPAGVVLWTRLAPVPDAPGGGMLPEVIPVRWQIARDETMKAIAAQGTAYATPDWAHSVHVDALGLEPGRPYWYRFTAGDAQSPIGRTRTAPVAGSPLERFRFAFASCQHYEQGYFSAYAHMLKDEPDLVVFLGDYIYEADTGRQKMRRHQSPDPRTLDDYRIRHALYKSDLDLQSAHAQCPWILTWDDHEVDNDYAGDRSVGLEPPELFLARRAAAYKAFYEHLPMRRSMLPQGPWARIYTRLAWGELAVFHVLDDRQFRSPQACAPLGRGGSSTVDVAACPALGEPSRTLLGAAQEQWLEAGLAASRTRWNILAQQSMMARLDQRPGEGRGAWTDAWDGYPAARNRLLGHVAARKVSNPVVIGGDIHSFAVADLRSDFDDPRSPVVASEIVGTSITSGGWTREFASRFLPDNPHVKLLDGSRRGYVRVEVSPGRMRADLRVMESVARRGAACETLASFVIENGRPGPMSV